MTQPFPDGQNYLEAFIKTAQYLAGLTTQQDVWDQLGKVLVNFFGADFAGFAETDKNGEIIVHHWTFARDTSTEVTLSVETRETIYDVLDTGFLASKIIQAPAPSSAAFLPVTLENRSSTVMIAGHRSTDDIPKERLNVYLAVAGLASTTITKLSSERELRKHRAHLEDLVRLRTHELTEANKGLERENDQRKRAEEQLQVYAAELEEKNEEIKQFVYIVSHDLRAPLVNLKGFSSELRFSLDVIHSALDDAVLSHLDETRKKGVATALQEDLPEALGFIDSSVTSMDHFINALLKLSRLGRRELHFELLDMDEIVQLTLSSLAHQIHERRINVVVNPLPPVVADRTAMEQIMGNLLNNAVIYLDPNRAGKIEVYAEINPHQTIFHVHDNGRGISKKDMPKVFALFRRAGSQDVAGEGMGLSYVQTLVRRHGGQIRCESEPGVSTTFAFHISDQLKETETHA